VGIVKLPIIGLVVDGALVKTCSPASLKLPL